jgi:hypothetical protein
MPMCLVQSSTVCRKYLIQTGTVVSCLIKCQLEGMSVSNRSLPVLRVLRTNNVENHALVFMVPGLHRNWKQPVAYYFSCRGLNSWGDF